MMRRKFSYKYGGKIVDKRGKVVATANGSENAFSWTS